MTTLVDRATLDAIGDLLGHDGLAALLATFGQELTVRPREIADQLASGNPGAARAAAHYLKGPAGMLGAQAVAALAGKLELAPDRDLTSLAAELAATSAATRSALSA